MLKTKTFKMGGINRKEFVEYFLRIADETDDQGTFRGCGWEVLVGLETWSIHGSIKIPRVSITINVEEDKFEKFVSKFQLSFLRGGG